MEDAEIASFRERIAKGERAGKAEALARELVRARDG